MQVRTPGAWPRDEGDFAVRGNGGNGDPFATISLDEDGKLQLVMASPEDCDRLIRAAAAAKDMILRQREKAVTPHGPRIAAGRRECLDCGQREDGPLHATAELLVISLVISDATIEQARLVADDIAAGTWPPKPDGEPTARSLAAEREMRIRLGYDRQAHLAWYEREHPDAPEFPDKPRTEAQTLAVMDAYTAAESAGPASPEVAVRVSQIEPEKLLTPSEVACGGKS